MHKIQTLCTKKHNRKKHGGMIGKLLPQDAKNLDRNRFFRAPSMHFCAGGNCFISIFRAELFYNLERSSTDQCPKFMQIHVPIPFTIQKTSKYKKNRGFHIKS